MRPTPFNSTIVGTGIIGTRLADVQIYHQEAEGIEKRSVQIVFQDDTTKLYYIGNGAHVVTFDPLNRSILEIDVKRGQDAHDLMVDLLTHGRPQARNTQRRRDYHYH